MSFDINLFEDSYDSITFEHVNIIERELDNYDVISLVFLLYDIPLTALQRLIVFQKSSNEQIHQSFLLSNWVLEQQKCNTNWRKEFIEALTTCQLYGCIRKLGINVEFVKQVYQPNNIESTVYLDPMKKALYKLCENMDSKQFGMLKNALSAYDIDVSELEVCEMVILHLITLGFIDMRSINKHTFKYQYNIQKLIKVIACIEGLTDFTNILSRIQDSYNMKSQLNVKNTEHNLDKSSEFESERVIDSEINENNKDDNFHYFSLLNEMAQHAHFKIDTNQSEENYYKIKNPNRLGICYIINQEIFSCSPKSSLTAPLDNRTGSTKDKQKLEKTMTSLNFEVIVHSNINHIKMIEGIKNIIKYRVQHDDSLFILCILSHGKKDHVYAADSVPVKVEDIVKLFDSEESRNLWGIPKVLIIQACQVNEESTMNNFVADAPAPYHIRKSDCLIYWATSRELAAYRHLNLGSIFIQILCDSLNEFVETEDLVSIFTRVNKRVNEFCKTAKKDQMPSIDRNTLMNKIYLKIPNSK